MTLEKLRDIGTLPGMTYEILTELVKRKEKEKIWKKKESLYGLCLILSSSGLILFMFFFQKGRIESLSGLIQFLNNPVSWVLGGASFVAAFVFLRTHRESESAEDDFDELRKEVIDRGEELWPKEPDGSTRYTVMQFLLKKKGINLFYK
ncbi:DUF2663 family protein [Sporolactobacillus putidus]|uniref:DUF2663 family protein n=1 Tax=Sporolactobacillus putidus TaxID=492735 RepID=A0A917RZ69_9BACL|nr:DUF2663 family protein [Sporolactobacillus putidus]GGL46939.1 hypothetical protein GCM10007968_08790 [Sporolactobacillus putidus]